MTTKSKTKMKALEQKACETAEWLDEQYGIDGEDFKEMLLRFIRRSARIASLSNKRKTK